MESKQVLIFIDFIVVYFFAFIDKAKIIVNFLLIIEDKEQKMKKSYLTLAVAILVLQVQSNASAQSNLTPSIDSDTRSKAAQFLRANNLPSIASTNSAPSRASTSNSLLDSQNVQIKEDSSKAFRFLQVEDDSQFLKKIEEKNYLKGVLTQVGVADASAQVRLDGFAKDLPLIEVLKQILPNGWRAFASTSANVNTPVSWQGGVSWVSALEKMSKEHTLNLVVDWNEKIVRVMSQENLIALNKSKEKVSNIVFARPNVSGVQNQAPGVNGANVFVMANNQTPITSVNPVNPIVNTPNIPNIPNIPNTSGGTNLNNSAPLPNASMPRIAGLAQPQIPASLPSSMQNPPRQVTQAPANPIANPIATAPMVRNTGLVKESNTPHFGIPGVIRITEGTLKQNLEEMAKNSKFKLIYQDITANYSIQDQFVLRGSLDGENGVIAQLAELYGEGKVKQPLEFEWKLGGEFKTLIVSNKTYEQKFFKELPSVSSTSMPAQPSGTMSSTKSSLPVLAK